jgi:hypothetical protein
MTPAEISQQIREASFSEVESDIPVGVTLAEYAASRRRRPSGLKARVASIFLPGKPR